MAPSGRVQTVDTVIDKAIDVLSSAIQILIHVSCVPPGVIIVINSLKTILQTVKVRF